MHRSITSTALVIAAAAGGLTGCVTVSPQSPGGHGPARAVQSPAREALDHLASLRAHPPRPRPTPSKKPPRHAPAPPPPVVTLPHVPLPITGTLSGTGICGLRGLPSGSRARLC